MADEPIAETPIQQTTTLVSTEEPKKNVMDYAMQTIEVNRMISIGMLVIAAICVISNLRVLHLPGVTPDDIAASLANNKELTLMILSALAGMLTSKK